MLALALHAQQLAKSNAELGHHEAEHDNADAGANPGEEGALVGQMIAGFANLAWENLELS